MLDKHIVRMTDNSDLQRNIEILMYLIEKLDKRLINLENQMEDLKYENI